MGTYYIGHIYLHGQVDNCDQMCVCIYSLILPCSTKVSVVLQWPTYMSRVNNSGEIEYIGMVAEIVMAVAHALNFRYLWGKRLIQYFGECSSVRSIMIIKNYDNFGFLTYLTFIFLKLKYCGRTTCLCTCWWTVSWRLQEIYICDVNRLVFFFHKEIFKLSVPSWYCEMIDIFLCFVIQINHNKWSIHRLSWDGRMIWLFHQNNLWSSNIHRLFSRMVYIATLCYAHFVLTY